MILNYHIIPFSVQVVNITLKDRSNGQVFIDGSGDGQAIKFKFYDIVRVGTQFKYARTLRGNHVWY